MLPDKISDKIQIIGTGIGIGIEKIEVIGQKQAPNTHVIRL